MSEEEFGLIKKGTMRMVDKKDKGVLQLYLLKRIAEKTDKAIAAFKSHYSDLGVETLKDANDLEVKFSEVAGRRKFSEKLAIKFLKRRLPSEEFQSHFVTYEIQRKPGSPPPPPPLLQEMEKYFAISPKESVAEDFLKAYQFTGLEPWEIAKNCYEHNDPTTMMRTPSKVSDRELLEKAKALKVDMTKLLLEEP